MYKQRRFAFIHYVYLNNETRLNMERNDCVGVLTRLGFILHTVYVMLDHFTIYNIQHNPPKSVEYIIENIVFYCWEVPKCI